MQEERQIEAFVEQVAGNPVLRQELASDPETVLQREGFTPTVFGILLKLVPHLTLHAEMPSLTWWH